VSRVIEALTDPKTWLFALSAALDGVPNSLSNQIQIIVLSFGFTTLHTTLLGCVGGLTQIVPNLGISLVNLLPWHNKVGLLFSLWITSMHDVLLRRGII
jgi:ACS family allantoate permease-like MFS transporter